MVAPSGSDELIEYARAARRNEIAMATLQSLLRGPRGEVYVDNPAAAAKKAYALADAFLAEAGKYG